MATDKWINEAEENRKRFPQFRMIDDDSLKRLPKLAFLELKYRRYLRRKVNESKV